MAIDENSNPSPSPGKLTYNEKVIANSKGDYITLDVAGNKTAPIDVFREDLANGEVIVREFSVDLKPPAYRSFFWFLVKCICTAGLYFVYIKFCSCCRPKVINTRRSKLVLTNKGRLGVWDADVWGVQSKNMCCCIRGHRGMNSCTHINWFHINDLSHVQQYHYIHTWNLLCCCWKKNNWESSIRLFFGVFPDQAIVDGYNMRLAVPKVVSTDIGLSAEEIGTYFSVRRYFKEIVLFFSNAVSEGLTLVGLKEFSRSIMLEISTGKSDMLHTDPATARSELNEIHKALLEMKKTAMLKWNTVHHENFELVDKLTPLVENDKAMLNLSNIAMMPNEVIVDAFTFYNHWTLREIFFTVFTLGWYWLSSVRFRHALRSALVVTNFRLLEISENMPKMFCVAPGSCLTSITRSWFLNGIDTGFIVRTRKQLWTKIQVQYGSLCIVPSVRSSFFYGINKDDCVRAMKFMRGLSNFNMPAVFAADKCFASPQIPEVLSENHLSVLPNEQFLVELKGAGLKYNGCYINGVQPPVCITYPLTCGYYPYKVHQEIAITSHRLVATSYAKNTPFLFQDCVGQTYRTYFWSTLNSRYFIGTQTLGEVNVMENLLTRCLSMCGCILGKEARSGLSLSYAFSSTRKGFPITIESEEEHPTSGLLDNTGLVQLRSILGNLHAAKTTHGPDPYFAAPPPSKDALPGPQTTVQQYYQIPVMTWQPVVLVPAQYPAVAATQPLTQWDQNKVHPQ